MHGKLLFMINCLSLVFCSFILSLSAQAQDPQNSAADYFRYFEVTTGALSSDAQQKISNAFSRQDVIQTKMFCTRSNKLLIAVKADYPKRIDEISEEIRKTLKAAMKETNVFKIETIALSDTSNFCK